ncbi:PQQ-like beta-propeller repeat protein [Zavarzinia compransoris]|uniref:PQQ-like beta-propeller repeat protein n=1 Tax=Zavarzinia marina TaxID=2911065 RepID=UPI001F1EF814|nr:PQQ-like beta-propeller repeat protein [Zavarzinia marina]MCF4164955.1 PQQ-like beta-propeller repeat protein [Zavarzinia marina]
MIANPSQSRAHIHGRPLKPLAVVLLTGFLGACSSLNPFGGEEVQRVEGERIAVLGNQSLSVEPDAAIADVAVRLPPPYLNMEWPQPGGFPAHALYHLQTGPELKVAWTARAGAGDSSDTRLIAQPIVTGDSIYVLDTTAHVNALDLEGQHRWSVNLQPEDEDSPTGFFGGVAYDGGRVYVTTGYGDVVALNAGDGSEVWRRPIGIPFRSAPTVNGGRVFGITQDNQLFALSTDDGEVLWNHVGISESAGFLGAASPAVSGEAVVVPFSSGELFALRVENGRVIWSDNLIRTGATTPIAALNDIRGQVVVDRGDVFASSHSGSTVGIELRTGTRLWDRSIGSSNTPWAGGDFIYMISDDNEVICLTRAGGRVRWVTRLPRFEDEEDATGAIVWSGPVLAGDRLLLASNTGVMTAISPYTGDALGTIQLPGRTTISPVVANGTVYVLMTDGRIAAIR